MDVRNERLRASLAMHSFLPAAMATLDVIICCLRTDARRRAPLSKAAPNLPFLRPP